jgi:hypothetical protein
MMNNTERQILAILSLKGVISGKICPENLHFDPDLCSWGKTD